MGRTLPGLELFYIICALLPLGQEFTLMLILSCATRLVPHGEWAHCNSSIWVTAGTHGTTVVIWNDIALVMHVDTYTIETMDQDSDESSVHMYTCTHSSQVHGCTCLQAANYKREMRTCVSVHDGSSAGGSRPWPCK